jgi:hypothetical protein
MADGKRVSSLLARRAGTLDVANRKVLHDSRGADDRSYTHLLTVLSVSSGMVGVCLTAIGLIGIIKSLSRIELVVDELLSIGAVLFMITAIFSFLGMRSNFIKTWRGFGLALDLVFCLGLVLVVIATIMLTWVVI